MRPKNRPPLLSLALAAVLLIFTAGTVWADPIIWGDYTTDEDNQNNNGFGEADHDMDGEGRNGGVGTCD